MKKQSRFFSMVELLVVIAIIALLAGIAMPVYSNVRSKARIAQAQADCRAIAVAVAKMNATYGKMTSGATEKIAAVDSYLQELSNLAATPTVNKRKIVFLDPKADGGDWRDPWGEAYIIYVDTDYDNKVTINSKTLHGSVFVYSLGPDKTEFTDDDVKSW